MATTAMTGDGDADDAPADALAATLAGISSPDREAESAARARWDGLVKPRGSLGRLEDIGAWLAGVQGRCPPHPPAQPVVIVVAGDHGVARAARTSAYPPEVTAQMVRTFAVGAAGINALADRAGARVRVLDLAVDADPDYLAGIEGSDDIVGHRIRRSSGAIDRVDALTEAEVRAAIAVGMDIVDREVDAGADLIAIGDMGIGNTTVAATLVGLLAPADPVAVVGRGTGIDDATWMRKCAAVRDAMRRGRARRGDPVDLLAAVGGADLAAMTGVLLRAAYRRIPVILDGTVPTSAALVAHRLSHRARAWWLAGHRSTEPAHAIALDRLDLLPVLDLGLRLGEGTGATLAIPLVTAAASALAEMATFADAGVSTGTTVDDAAAPDARA